MSPACLLFFVLCLTKRRKRKKKTRKRLFTNNFQRQCFNIKKKKKRNKEQRDRTRQNERERDDIVFLLLSSPACWTCTVFLGFLFLLLCFFIVCFAWELNSLYSDNSSMAFILFLYLPAHFFAWNIRAKKWKSIPQTNLYQPTNQSSHPAEKKKESLKQAETGSDVWRDTDCAKEELRLRDF